MRNLEVKARVRDRARVERDIVALGARFAGILEQRDVFYRSRRGRLKLRLASDGSGELIHYEREDAARVRSSDYTRVPVADGLLLAAVLDAALQPTGEVRKTRRLFLLENLRIHLDDVQHLGCFFEVEAIVDAAHSEAACRAAAERVLAACEIQAEDRVGVAYIDLLAARG